MRQEVLLICFPDFYKQSLKGKEYLQAFSLCHIRGKIAYCAGRHWEFLCGRATLNLWFSFQNSFLAFSIANGMKSSALYTALQTEILLSLLEASPSLPALPRSILDSVGQNWCYSCSCEAVAPARPSTSHGQSPATIESALRYSQEHLSPTVGL